MASNYYFMVKGKGKSNYIRLDIPKSKYFMRTSKCKGNNMSLEEADLFTMMFNTEEELRIALLKEGILDYQYAASPLSIRLFRNNEYHKVMYDFLYQKDIEYVMNPKSIITKINNKLISKDYRFISQFASTFSGFYDAKKHIQYGDCSTTVSEVKMYVNDIINNHMSDKYLQTRDENGDNQVVRMAKLLIYEYDQLSDGRIVYKNKIKYRNLHMIIAFINNYEKQYGLKESEENKQLNLFDTMQIPPKPKKRVLKKKTNIPGQINLFDE